MRGLTLRALAAAAALARSSVRAMLPGIAPQCFPEYQCIFHRFNQPYGASWSWDFRQLCAPAGQEYAACQGVASCPAGVFPRIIFNICGMVAGPAIAPYDASAAPTNMTLPQPHSRGTAIQVLDDPVSFEAGFRCPDTDTCDQDTNPLCAPGSLNYDPNRNFINQNTGLPVSHNRGMEARCAQPSPPPACFVSSTACTGNIELLSYYDGQSASFSLYDEGQPGGVTAASPSNGINFTFTPSLLFSDQRFQCTNKDPRTGLPVVRTVNVFIACNPAGYTTDPLVVTGFTEQGQCQYYVTASHLLACGAPGDPYNPDANPTPAPSPAAPAVAFSLNANQLVGTVVGAVAAITVAVQTLVGVALFFCLVPPATRAASCEAAYACCCCCLPGARGGMLAGATARSPRAYFKDGHAKTEMTMPGSAGMFVERPVVGSGDRFATNPLGALDGAAK